MGPGFLSIEHSPNPPPGKLALANPGGLGYNGATKSPKQERIRLGLLDFFKTKKEPPKVVEPPKDDSMDPAFYSHMRVEVTTPDGQLLFVAKLMYPRGTTAELHQYSENDAPQEEDAEPRRVCIRGYHDRERKAVYMEGVITPKPKHVWLVEELSIARLGNDRAFFRLDMNIDATATTFSGPKAGERPCKLVNISVGGACIASEYHYQEDDKFLLTVRLLEDRETSVMFCQVLRIFDRGEGRFEYGCCFLELTEADQEKITQNIFAAQRKTRGSSR